MTEDFLNDSASRASSAPATTRAATWWLRALPRGMYRLHCEIVADVCSTAHRWRISLRDFAKVHWASIWGGISAMVLCGTSFVENSILPSLKAQMSSGDFKKIVLAMLVAGATQALISLITKGRPPTPGPAVGPPQPLPTSPPFSPAQPPLPPPQAPFPKW